MLWWRDLPVLPSPSGSPYQVAVPGYQCRSTEWEWSCPSADRTRICKTQKLKSRAELRWRCIVFIGKWVRGATTISKLRCVQNSWSSCGEVEICERWFGGLPTVQRVGGRGCIWPIGLSGFLLCRTGAGARVSWPYNPLVSDLFTGCAIYLGPSGS